MKSHAPTIVVQNLRAINKTFLACIIYSFMRAMMWNLYDNRWSGQSLTPTDRRYPPKKNSENYSQYPVGAASVHRHHAH
jgi:hypothetical protein